MANSKSTGWHEFYKEEIKNLRKLPENKGKKTKDLMPILTERWIEMQTSEIEVEEEEIPNEPIIPKKSEVTEDIKKEPIKEEFDYQCEKCGYMFNGKPEKCEKCGLVFKYE